MPDQETRALDPGQQLPGPGVGQKGKAFLATRGAAIILCGRALRIICQFVGLIVTARYLTSFDFGLVAMVGAIVGAASMLGDFGLSLSALRSPALTTLERNSLCWTNAALGLSLALIVAAAAPYLAEFYSEPRVANIALWFSPIFIFNGASAQYRTDMMRRSKYIETAAIDSATAVLGLVVGIAAAASGAGYWTLVAQNVSVSVVTFLLLIYCCAWLPSFKFRLETIRPHIGFGWFSTITQVCNYCSSNVSSVALGKFLGADAVGLFSRAFQLFSLPVDQLTSPLTSLILPLLAQVELKALPQVLQRVQRCLVYAVLGVCLLVAVGGSPLVTIVLGEKWAGVASVVQVLMIGAIFQLSGYVYYWAFLLTGNTRSLFWCEVPCRVVMAGLVAIGARNGEIGAAIGHSVGLAGCWLVAGTFGMRVLGWRIGPLLFGAVLPVALYLWAFTIGTIARVISTRYVDQPIVSLFITMVFTIAGILSGLVLPVYRRHARELLELASSLFKKSPSLSADKW
jgi:PST family polysaccharide transporter